MPDLMVNAGVLGPSRLPKLRVLASLAGLMLLVYLPVLAARIVYTKDGQSTNDVMVFLMPPVACLALMVGIPVLVAARARRPVTFDRTWVRWTRSEVAWFCLLPVAVVASALVLGLLQERTGLPIRWNVGFEHGHDIAWLLAGLTINGVLLAPFAEELFWRGYVQSTLAQVCHPITAIVTQAVFFGLYHCRPALGTAMAIAPGLVYGVWCWRRKTLVPVIVAHMMGNAFAFSYDWAGWRELIRIKPAHDYTAEFMEMSKPVGYEPNDDARQEYSEAFRLAVEPAKEIYSLREQYPTHRSDQEKTQVEAWLASNAQALELVKEGSQKPYYWPEYKYGQGQLATPSVVHGEEMRWLGVALAERALVAATQGRYGEAIDDVSTCYRVGRHLLQCKDTASQLMGVGIYGLASQTARAILYHEDIGPELMTDLQERLEKPAAEQPIRFDVRSEQFLPLETIQRLFTDDGQGRGHIPERALSEWTHTMSYMLEAADSNIDEWRKLDRRSVAEDVRQYYRAFEEATSLAPWDYERNPGEAKSTIERIIKSDPLIRLFSLNLRIMHLSAKTRAELDSVITILAILRYKADRQEFPESLEQLVAESYLKKVPRDPYSDGALIYQRTGDNFLLYSRGADFDDDGGLPSKRGEGKEGGDQVFWPVQERD